MKNVSEKDLETEREIFLNRLKNKKEKRMINPENRKSQISANLEARHHSYFQKRGIIFSEWCREKADEEIRKLNLCEFIKKSPVTPEFARDNILVRTSPPFQRIHETKQDNDGRVVGSGFVMRLK